PSPSATPSRTATQTLTPSTTGSPPPTLTPSYSVSPTRSASPTATPSAIPVPFKISVKVFNAAGEEVAILYSGGMTAMPGAPVLDSSIVQSGSQGAGQVGLKFAGTLDNGSKFLY